MSAAVVFTYYVRVRVCVYKAVTGTGRLPVYKVLFSSDTHTHTHTLRRTCVTANSEGLGRNRREGVCIRVYVIYIIRANVRRV